MYNKQVTIINPTGLHARPAAQFCNKASQFKSDLTIKRLTANPKEGNAKSVITVMSMGLSKGTTVELSGQGADEVAAIDTLAAMIESGFGEV